MNRILGDPLTRCLGVRDGHSPRQRHKQRAGWSAQKNRTTVSHILSTHSLQNSTMGVWFPPPKRNAPSPRVSANSDASFPRLYFVSEGFSPFFRFSIVRRKR